MAKTTTKAKKATPTPPATTPDKRTLEPHELVLSPTIQSAVGIQAWGKFAGEVDLAKLLDDLRTRVEKVQGGDMRPVEAMLYGQAVTLETIFTSLARRAAQNAGEYLGATDTYMRLALKAQAQCRATLEALAEIKNPRPVAFVKQANISNGPQQVNNGVSNPASKGNEPVRADAQAHAGKISGQQNGLLEHQHGNYLHTRAQSTSGGADPHLEAVEAGHRAAHA
jgi:hypothetical protein